MGRTGNNLFLRKRCLIHFKFGCISLIIGMVRLQAEMGPGGLRRCQDTSRPVREHLAAGHCPLQQVSLKKNL